MSDWYDNLKNNYDFLIGFNHSLTSFNFHEKRWLKKPEGHELDSYYLTEKASWKILSGQKELHISGRVIGGCLDILICLCGTKYDKVKEYAKRYSDEKFIWYFESCDLDNPSQIRAIWQLKNAGWFDNACAFIIGRPLKNDSVFNTSYKKANYMHLKDFKVPVIIDADIGHVPPSMHVVNGAIMKVDIYENDDKTTNVKINYELK